jgi:hypothetical protein
MKRLVLAMFLGIAGMAGATDMKRIAPVDDPAHEDIACASLAATVTANQMFGAPKQDLEKIPELADQCGKKSSVEICEETQKEINKANGKIRLRCTGPR